MPAWEGFTFGVGFTSHPLRFFVYNTSLKSTVKGDFIKTLGNFRFSTLLLSNFRIALESIHGAGYGAPGGIVNR